MNSRRAKLAAGATVLGLGALGGAALGTNPGMPAAPAGDGRRWSEGSSPAPAAQRPPSVSRSRSDEPGARPPIVTRASGAGPLPGAEADD